MLGKAEWLVIKATAEQKGERSVSPNLKGTGWDDNLCLCTLVAHVRVSGVVPPGKRKGVGAHKMLNASLGRVLPHGELGHRASEDRKVPWTHQRASARPLQASTRGREGPRAGHWDKEDLFKYQRTSLSRCSPGLGHIPQRSLRDARRSPFARGSG